MNKVIELDRNRDGRWTWRYTSKKEEVELRSNQDFDTEGAARESARTAYPRVRIRMGRVEEIRPRNPQRSSKRQGGILGLIGRIAALGAVAIAWRRRSKSE
ncbi:MAG: hypothetical protein M3280_07600 [Actinomycetota bacterium]|nr:hypothetical protein [Actinomycetota bacterium]